jgi:hypothetical protein
MSPNIVKIGGTAGLLAAALFVITTGIAVMAPVGIEYVTTTDYLHQIALFLAFACTLVAVVGLHVHQRPSPRYGRLGTVGTVLTFIGYAVVTVVVAVGIVVGGRAITEVRLGGSGILLLGSILLGIVTFRTRLAPWWCALLLIVAFPLGDVANAVFAGSEGLLLALLWGSVGVALLTRPATKAPEPVIARPARVG